MVAKRKKAAAKNASPSKKAAKVAPKAQGLDGLFEAYADHSEEGVIGPEGIERLCKDLNVSPSDRRVLILAHIMGAERMGYFSRQQFFTGCQRLGVKTLPQLKKALPQLDSIISTPPSFHSFFTFAFRFCLTDPSQKIIEKETAAEMLPLAYPKGRFVNQFSEFLNIQSDYKVINKDQWINFLKFSIEVREDLSNANDNPAWPLLIDNFVEWQTARTRR